MKKMYSAAMIALAFMVLVSCGKKEAAKDAGPQTIEFWHSVSGGRGKVLQAQVDEFNALNNGVTVNATYQGTYYDMGAKLQAAVASGEKPEMVQLEIGRIGLYAFQDELVDLNPYFKRDGEKVEDFIPGLMNYSYLNNKLIALPHGRSTPLFYYNKDLFKAAGLDPEKAPATWEELAVYAQKLSTGGVYGFSVPIDTWYYLAMVMAAGGDLFNKEGNNIGFNNEAGAKPLRFWLDLIQKGYMHVPPGQEYNSSEACRNNFIAGKVAMMMQSTGSLVEMVTAAKFEVGVGFMPKEVRYAVPPGGANYMLMAGHPKAKEEAAWQFLKWITNTQNSAHYSINTGYFPTRFSALETQIFKDYAAKYPNATISVDQLQYANFPSPFQPEWAEIKDVIVNNEIQRCILDPAVTPEMAVQRIYEASAKLFK